MKKVPHKLKEWALDLGAVVAGCALYAVSVHMFTNPNMIAVGGLTGIGSVLNYLWGLPIGLSVLLMNVPLFLLSWKKLGKEFFFKTAFATVMMSLFLDLTGFLPVFTGDKLLATVTGGVGTGAGLGLIFSRGMATGGTDLLAKLVKGWFRGVSYAKVILFADVAILIFAGIVYRDLWSVLYSAVTVWLMSAVVDAILGGIDKAKSVSIITDKRQAVLDRILIDINRGATVWNAEGGYTSTDRDVILVVVRKYELFSLKQAVKSADPDAFMIISDATEVMGRGFREGTPEE